MIFQEYVRLSENELISTFACALYTILVLSKRMLLTHLLTIYNSTINRITLIGKFSSDKVQCDFKRHKNIMKCTLAETFMCCSHWTLHAFTINIGLNKMQQLTSLVRVYLCPKNWVNVIETQRDISTDRHKNLVLYEDHAISSWFWNEIHH